MEVATLVGEALLSATVELLFSKLSSSVSEWLNLPEKVRAEMQNWSSLLPKIGDLLEDAEEKQETNRLVKSWLADFRDLAYDMEDMLEEVEIDEKRSKLIAEAKPSTSKPQKLIFPKLFNKVGRFTAKGERKMAARMKDITARLQRIEAEQSTLGLIRLTMRSEDKSHKVAAERLPTTSLLEHRVYGRETDKEAILQILLSDEDRHEPYSVIPIVGMGGIGKSTLAQLIYNDDKVKGRFGLQAWVCVSEHFDVDRITRAILDHVTMGNCDLKELTPLQEKLQDKLSGQKFLLVLDDIWNENYELWEKLQRPFLKGAQGSKIIITTRNENIGKMITGNDRVHHLSLLEDDACLSLFAQHALEAENFDGCLDLKRVGEKIVEKCKRLPLAIKALGGLLRGKADPVLWQNILYNKIWDLPDGSVSILPALKLSYNYLPSHLKRCFGYCSIFPKDYEFDEGELVLLWMAEGLVQQPQRMKKVKDLGHQYFYDLLSRAFFQRSSRDESLFVMHDLMVDLALHVAGETCCTLESDGKMSNVSFQRARHLSLFPSQYEVSKRFEFLKEKKNLRTILPLKNFGYLSNTLLQDLMKDLKCLRVLSLQNYKITKLPDQIGDLKHLRYIDLSYTEIESLPESVGYLLYLQTLLLRECEELSQLPATIGNLLDLQHLDIAETPCLKEFPSKISKLTSLVTLSKFIVGNARGPRVKDLKNLSCLQGQLSILDLQNVVAANEAKEVNLFEIEGLDDLSLEWSSDFLNNRNEGSEMEVLRWLKPYQGLKRLTINCFGGSGFPPWIGDPSFYNLEFLMLNNCQKSTSLPSLQQLPRLKELIITGIHAIQTMMLDKDNSSSALAFPLLESLILQDCPILKGKFPKCIPALKKLEIAGCPELIYSPISLPSLEELRVENCSEAGLRSMVDLKSLKTLRISRISKLIWLPKSFVESLIALEYMGITSCDELTCLREEGANMVNLPCLKSMQISGCPLLVSLTGKEQGFLPNSVQSLSINDCEALESLPIEIMTMVRLEYLYISRCPALRMFPRGKLPTTLKTLTIGECEKLESLPEGILMNNGDAFQVSHLVELSIYRCPCLKSFPTGHLPNSFKRLTVSNCRQLEFIPQSMLQYYRELEEIHIDGNHARIGHHFGHYSAKYGRHYIYKCSEIDKLDGLDGLESLYPFIPNLKSLAIENFKNLKSLPDKLQDLNSLNQLHISNCPGIESIPDGGLPPNLTSLRIYDCPGIGSISDGGFPPNLRSLFIWNCKNLKSLPDKLQDLNSLDELDISNCPEIESIPGGGLPPNLTSLQIYDCPGIKSIPDCGSAPNLGKLIINCKNLKKPMQEWGLSSLTSLLTFEIAWMCPPDNVLPTSLTSLAVRNVENMKSISRGLLQNLNSLQCLEIENWPKLQTLPEEALPASLQELIIWDCKNLRSLPNKGPHPSLEQLNIAGCPLLERRYIEEEKEDYSPFVAHIPYIELQGDESHTSSETKQKLCLCFKTG